MTPDTLAIAALVLLTLAGHAVLRAGPTRRWSGAQPIAMGLIGLGLAILVRSLTWLWPAAQLLAHVEQLAVAVAAGAWCAAVVTDPASATHAGRRAWLVGTLVALGSGALLVSVDTHSATRITAVVVLLAALPAVRAVQPVLTGVAAPWSLAVTALLGSIILLSDQPLLLWLWPLAAAAAAWALAAAALRVDGESQRRLGWPAGLVAMGLMTGLGATVAVDAWHDAELRSDLHQRAVLVAAALDPADLGRHIPDRRILATDWFKRTKIRFQELRAVDPTLQYVYLLRLQGDHLYFPNDDEPLDSADPTDPENPYSECPPAIRAAVAGNAAFVVGPYGDRWGSFISTGVPVADPAGGSPVFVCLDVTTVHWQSDLAQWRLPVAGLAALGTLLAVVLVGRARAQRRSEAARREAEEANRAKDSYLAAVSHELRTPLNGIIGMTSLLAETELSRQQREFVELAHDSGQQLLGLINSLLDFARIEAGHLELEIEPFELREVIDDAIALLAERALAKGLELAAVVDPAIPSTVEGDAQRLRQVVMNLVGNALKFTEHGTVVLRLVLAPGGDPTRVDLALSVTDTGIGMDAETQSRIFRPFIQADHSIAGRFGGTGLGLVITRRLIEAMDGTITVTSTPGQGTCMAASLRLHCHQDETPPGERIAMSRRGSVVVVAVSNEVVREALAAQLAFLGLKPVLAADAMAAAQAAGAAGPTATALVESGWAGALTDRLVQLGLSVALVSTVNAGGTQLIAQRKVPVLTRPVRLATLAKVLARLWGDPSGSGLRRSTALLQPALISPEERAAHRPMTTPPPARGITPEAQPQLPVMDGTRLAQLRDDPSGHAQALELAAAFRNSAAAAVHSIACAAQAGDLLRVRELASALRHGASSLGLHELAELSLRLQAAAEHEAPTQVLALAGDLAEARRRAERAISEFFVRRRR